MKEEELRVGNLVGATLAGNSIPDGFENKLQEDLWNCYGQVIRKIESSNDINNAWWFFPIILTEEWLINLGFRKENNHIYLFPTNDSFRLWGFGWNIQNFTLSGWDDITTPRIQYVHQLQNLYFALTGEEL